MKPTLKLCSSHSATGISKTPDLVTSLEPVPLLFRARGTTRESLIEGAKQKHTQREGLYDLRIRCRGVGHFVCSHEHFFCCLDHISTQCNECEFYCFSFHSNLQSQLKGKDKQECIPVGFIPSTAVAISPAMHVSPLPVMHAPAMHNPCHACPPAMHASPPHTPPAMHATLTRTPSCEENDRQV